MDRIVIAVDGTWRVAGGGQEYWESALSHPETAHWFSVERNRRSLALTTRSRQPVHTLGVLNLTVSYYTGGYGRIQAEIVGNPTRTLAHLLAGLGAADPTPADLAAMSPAEFFARAPAGDVRHGLNGRSNWLWDIDRAYRTFGSAIFTGFLPIYVDQLQRLLVQLLSPTLGDAARSDGPDQVISGVGYEVRLDWGRVRVPQIEHYFERYHPRAKAAVHTASIGSLAVLQPCRARRYGDATDFERQSDAFVLTVELTNVRKLVVYAKSEDRLRFEVRRDGRSHYAPVGQGQRPTDRLLGIMALEGARASGACRWPQIGELFAEPAQPALADLIEFTALVADACAPLPSSARQLVSELLADGGISVAAASQMPRRVLSRLRASGVVEQVHIREREPQRGLRYVLTPLYRDLRLSVAQALSEG